MIGPIKLLPVVYQASARKVDRAGVLEDAGKLSPLQRNLASEKRVGRARSGDTFICRTIGS